MYIIKAFFETSTQSYDGSFIHLKRQKDPYQ